MLKCQQSLAFEHTISEGRLRGKKVLITYLSILVFRSKAVVLLLLTCCLLLLPLWESVIVQCFVVRYFRSIRVLHHLDWEE